MTYTQTFSVKELPSEYIVRKMYSLGYNTTYHKGNGSYNCGCPICHEGKSWGKKQRCWYLPEQNLIYCFNCGRGFTPYSWIKEAGSLTFHDIKREILGGEYYPQCSLTALYFGWATRSLGWFVHIQGICP